jgi:anti-anti-sigma factor
MNSAYHTSLKPSGATVLMATGRVTFHSADVLRQQLLDLIAAGDTHLVVDLSGVDAMDSSGVGALISGLKAARRAGGDLRLVAPSAPIAAMFTMMHLDNVLVTCESAEEAFRRSDCS